jgi:hypothetical protein
MKYAKFSKEGLSYGPIDETHNGDNFVRKFIDQTFANDYDIGKSSVYRSQEDIDKDTLRIINEMKAYDENPDTVRGTPEYNRRKNYYENMIKNHCRTTFNYDFKGMQELLDLIALRKQGMSYNPELTTLDLAQAYLDRIKKNRGYIFYGGRVLAEDLDFDPNTFNNIIILNNKDLPAAVDGYELNGGKKDRKNKRIRTNYLFKYQRDTLKGTPELKAFNAFYNLPLSVQQQYNSPAAWAQAVKTKTGNNHYFEPSMYVILGSQIREYLDEYDIKKHIV